MPASPTATPDHIKDVNTRYHDAAADSYDSKWGIDFGDIGQEQVASKLKRTLGGKMPEPFGDALEIGAGTGYFSLNLATQGLIDNLTATDISPGMLRSLKRTADTLGVPVKTVVTEAEVLPFEDESFDVVLGHAVLHHIPDLDKAFSEFFRVLRPGGVIVFCGEPSRYGDRLAFVPKKTGYFRRSGLAAPGPGPGDPAHRRRDGRRRARPRARGRRPRLRSGRPPCDPARGRLRTHPGPRRRTGRQRLGLGNALDGSHGGPGHDPDPVAELRLQSYIGFQKVDQAVLEPYLPAELFYNLLLSASKPA